MKYKQGFRNYALFFWRIIRQKSLIMRIAQQFKAKILMSRLINLACLSRSYFTILSIFKAKTRPRKLFCREINRSRAPFRQAVIGYVFSNHGVCYIKDCSTGPNAQQYKTPC